MTFNEYQKQAWVTANYPNAGVDTVYPMLGLCGEIGELCNKLKKQIRDNVILSTEQILDELGDIYWYVAALATTFKYEPTNERTFGSEDLDLYESVLALYESSAAFISTHNVSILNMYMSILYNICDLYYTDPAVVWQRNIAKLADRAARNVLGGSGDNR